MAKTNRWNEKRKKSYYVYEQDYEYINGQKERVGKKQYIGKISKDKEGKDILIPSRSNCYQDISKQVAVQRARSYTQKKSSNDELLYNCLKSIKLLKDAESSTNFESSYTGLSPNKIIHISDKPELLLLTSFTKNEFVEMGLFTLLDALEDLKPAVIINKTQTNIISNLERKGFPLVLIDTKKPNLTFDQACSISDKVNYSESGWTVKKLDNERDLYGKDNENSFIAEKENIKDISDKVIIDAFYLIQEYKTIDRFLKKAPGSLKLALLDYSWRSNIEEIGI